MFSFNFTKLAKVSHIINQYLYTIKMWIPRRKPTILLRVSKDALFTIDEATKYVMFHSIVESFKKKITSRFYSNSMLYFGEKYICKVINNYYTSNGYFSFFLCLVYCVSILSHIKKQFLPNSFTYSYKHLRVFGLLTLVVTGSCAHTGNAWVL